MRLGKTEFDCIRCNNHGVMIKVVTKDEMREHLDYAIEKLKC